MEIKQAALFLMIFFSLLLVSSSSKILYPAKLQENKAGEKRKEKGELVHITVTYHISAHRGGSAGGGRGGSSGSASEGDSGSDTRKPAGASNENHHRRGASTRVGRSVFFIWVVAIFVTQFSMQML